MAEVRTNPFYTIIKACDEHIRFVLLTGVSKFSKAGVFSGLNNLEDISMDAKYSSLLGITRQEMESSFKEHIDQFSESEGIDKSELIKKIRNRDEITSPSRRIDLGQICSILNHKS